MVLETEVINKAALRLYGNGACEGQVSAPVLSEWSGRIPTQTMAQGPSNTSLILTHTHMSSLVYTHNSIKQQTIEISHLVHVCSLAGPQALLKHVHMSRHLCFLQSLQLQGIFNTATLCVVSQLK